MKTNKTYIMGIAVAVMMAACDPDVEIPRADEEAGYTKVYMPQAEGGARSYTLSIVPQPEVFVFGVAYGGRGFPSGDIQATLAVNPGLVDVYNDANGTDFAVLPGDAYSIQGNSVVIPAGEVTSSVITISVNTEAMTPFKDFLLPVQVESVDGGGVPLNETMKTAYYIIRAEPDLANYEQFDRAGWTVVDFSTEEPAEGSNGGLVTSALDGNNATFWHSQWNGGTPPPPHWFIVDMGEAHAMHGLAFLGRQSGNAGKPKDVTVEISMDGTNWTTAGTIVLENVNSLQNKFLVDGFNQEARYFKITVSSTYGADYTHLAELNAF